MEAGEPTFTPFPSGTLHCNAMTTSPISEVNVVAEQCMFFHSGQF